MTRQVRKYSMEFKQEAVKLALKKPKISDAAKELGIPAATVHGWVNSLKESSQVTTSPTTNAADMTILLEENRRLHKELAILKEEKDILKNRLKGCAFPCEVETLLTYRHTGFLKESGRPLIGGLPR